MNTYPSFLQSLHRRIIQSLTVCFRYLYPIDKNYLQVLLLPMTAFPTLSPLSPSAGCFVSYLEKQMETMCEFEEEYHHSSYWNHMFPSYCFERLAVQTDNSLVWIGKDRKSCETVALKITEVFEAETSEKMHQMKENLFLHEHRLSHMVEVRDIIHSKDFRLIVMKRYPCNLTHLLKQFTNTTKRYSQEHCSFVVFAFKAIVAAIEQLHSIRYVHRDLKPDNILVDYALNFVLTDFSLVTKELEIDTSSSGTLEYLPPERLSKKRRQSPIKASVDVWALGIILYELFTGDNAFNGQNEEQVLDSICQGYIRNKEIPVSAMNLINGMLEVNIDKRLTLEAIRNHPFLQKEVEKGVITSLVTLTS